MKIQNNLFYPFQKFSGTFIEILFETFGEIERCGKASFGGDFGED